MNNNTSQTMCNPMSMTTQLPQAYIEPMVVERSDNGTERAMDIASLLLGERMVLFTGQFDDHQYDRLIKQLLYLDSKSNDPIWLMIMSPGGSVYSGYGMINIIDLIKSPVYTVVTGIAASMGSFLAACSGAKNRRFMLPMTEHMIHQPLGGSQGQSSDMKIAADHIVRMRENLETRYAQATGQPLEVIHLECDRDNYMTPQESIAFGLADGILTPEIVDLARNDDNDKIDELLETQRKEIKATLDKEKAKQAAIEDAIAKVNADFE